MAASTAANTIGRDRFQALWQRCLVAKAQDFSADIHQRLQDAYSEPQRLYHTLDHIEHCLAMFDLCRHLLATPDAVELALWFHDVIYQPGASDNEARSAKLYQQHGREVHAAAICAQVDGLIMATLHRGGPIEDSDTQYMVDIDLSSFGLPWKEFLRDSKNLRQENPQISDADYYRNQSQFQSRLLGRERFYHSDFFHASLETQARQNLADYFEYMDKRA